MPEQDERLARIETKIDYISEDITEINKEMKKLNDRTNDVEDNYIALDIKTKKNCESIGSLWKRVNASKLTMKDKIAIVGIGITAITAIVVAVIGVTII